MNGEIWKEIAPGYTLSNKGRMRGRIGKLSTPYMIPTAPIDSAKYCFKTSVGVRKNRVVRVKISKLMRKHWGIELVPTEEFLRDIQAAILKERDNRQSMNPQNAPAIQVDKYYGQFQAMHPIGGEKRSWVCPELLPLEWVTLPDVGVWVNIKEVRGVAV